LIVTGVQTCALPIFMTIPLWILMAGSIVAGLLWLPFDLFVPFERWLAPVMEHHGEVHAAAAGAGLESLLMLTSLAMAAGGIGLEIGRASCRERVCGW